MSPFTIPPRAESRASGGETVPMPARLEPGSSGSRIGARRTALVYALLVAVPVAALSWVLRMGEALPAPAAIAEPPINAEIPASMAVLRLPLFLLQIVVIVVASRLLGIVLRRLGQPRVVGEMLAGLALGPSFLGLLLPETQAWLFPAGTVRFLNAMSQIGLVIFMFLVGLELDLGEFTRQGRRALVASHASIAVPMFAGGALAWFLFRDYSTEGTSFTVFALFMGCALSMNAFSVLARILKERQWTATPLGSTAMTCAAIADLSAWALLALVMALGRGHATEVVPAMLRAFGGVALYLLFMTLVVRRVLGALWRAHRARRAPEALELGQNAVSAFVIMVLVSSLITETLHIHALLGAFVAGVIMPRDPELASALQVRFEDLLHVLLLPLFFAYAGLRTDLGTISAPHAWGACLVVVLVAIAGKVSGGALASRMMGSSWLDAGSLGILMNARGTMELVLLTIGLQIGIITPPLFTILVIMAIVMTAVTTPLLALLESRRRRAAPELAAPEAEAPERATGT